MEVLENIFVNCSGRDQDKILAMLLGFTIPDMRPCCRKCSQNSVHNLRCYHGKFCGKCKSLTGGLDDPPIEYRIG